jgi:UDP-N-acetylglucosamine acyltransferase
VLTGKLEVGPDVRIFAGAVIGEEPQDLKFRGEPSSLRIGARTCIREHVTIHRGCGKGAETVIGDDVLLMANCHVAHDCRVGDRSIICNGALLAGHVELSPSVFVSGNAVLHQFVRIGRLAMIGGGSRVSRDVPSFGLLVGDSELRGINGVGLRRAGIARAAQEELRKAYSLLFRRTSNIREALPLLESTLKTPEGRELLAFLSATSRRGYCSMDKERRDLEESV